MNAKERKETLKMRKLREEGAAYATIASKFGIAPSTVRNRLKKLDKEELTVEASEAVEEAKPAAKESVKRNGAPSDEYVALLEGIAAAADKKHNVEVVQRKSTVALKAEGVRKQVITLSGSRSSLRMYSPFWNPKKDKEVKETSFQPVLVVKNGTDEDIIKQGLVLLERAELI